MTHTFKRPFYLCVSNIQTPFLALCLTHSNTFSSLMPHSERSSKHTSTCCLTDNIQSDQQLPHPPSVNGLPNTRTSHTSICSSAPDSWIRTTDPMGPWSQVADVSVSTTSTTQGWAVGLAAAATETSTVSGSWLNIETVALDSGDRS